MRRKYNDDNNSVVKIIPERKRAEKSSVLSRVIEPASIIGLIIGLITAVVYTFVFRHYSIFSSSISIPSQDIPFKYLLWGGFRLADVTFFIAIGVIAIKIALILRENSKNTWGHAFLYLMPVIGLLYFSVKILILNTSGPDLIFPIIAIIATILVLVIILGIYARISNWVRKWEQPIILIGLIVILVFLDNFYPYWIANDGAQKIMNGDSCALITLTPINNTSIIPSVPDNTFPLIAYQNNMFYVKESKKSCKVYAIPESQVKYAQTEIDSTKMNSSTPLQKLFTQAYQKFHDSLLSYVSSLTVHLLPI